MLIASIILTVLGIGCIFKAISDDYDGEGWFVGGFVLLVISFFVFLPTVNINWGTQNLTGYIYSNEDRAGYTVGHIRFSENAGTDEQPSFCAPSDSVAADKIKEYAGSGKKVKVTVPPYFYLSNNPFACGTNKVVVEEAK